MPGTATAASHHIETEGVPTREEATGIDEATFRRLRQRINDADDNGSAHTA